MAEVWGSPIGHSLSPALHNAAYRALGVDAHYSAREVTSAGLAGELAGLTPRHRGVSLTMPLKESILELVSDHRGLVDELGAANTVVRGDAGWCLWNTDPAGVAGALGEAGLGDVPTAVVLGAGATARSVLCALPDFGLSSVTVVSRERSRASHTLDYATRLGVSVEWLALDSIAECDPVELVVSTLPHGVDVAENIPAGVVAGSALFDVSYDPWPSSLARLWEAGENPVISGKSMLLHQAVAQIRLFVAGDASSPLPEEDRVLHAMRAALS